MKTAQKILALVVCLLASTGLFGQSGAYQQAMAESLASLKSLNPKTPVPDMLLTAGRFERIAQAEPREWLPRYYTGLLYVYAGFLGKDAAEKDRFLDKADSYLKEAAAISPKNDELSVLKAYIAQARLVVDPMNRWQTYGPAFEAAIAEAKALNPDNPRLYVLQGASLFHTPEQFGGGPKAACPVLTQASQKFVTFKPASDLHPNWGQKDLEPLLNQCTK